MQKAVSKAKQLFSDPELKKDHSTAINIGREIVKNRLGRGEMQVFTVLENTIAEKLGVSPSTLAKIVGVPKTAFYWIALGFGSPVFTAMSVAQPLYALPWHLRLSMEGFKHNPLDTFVKSGMDTFGMLLKHLGKDVETTPLGSRAAQYGIDNGIIDISAMSDVADLGRHEAIQTAEQVITFNITESEKVARASTFMSFVHHLDASKKFTNELEMFQRAEELTAIVMADYRASERAPIFNKMGITGSALSTLKTFTVNQFNQAYLLAKEAATKQRYMPFMTLLLLQYTLGGTLGMHGMKTLDSAWEFLKSWLPLDQWMKVKDVKIRETLATAALDNPAASWLAYGGISNLTGTNIGSRFDMGTIIDPRFDGLFPFIGDFQRKGSTALEFLADPTDAVARAKAIHALLPSAFKGLYETSSEVLSGPGGMSVQTSRPTEGLYRRTPEETTLRKIGLYSLPEAKERERIFLDAKSAAERKTRLQQISDKLHSAVLVGSDERVLKFYQQYGELQGTFPDLQKLYGDVWLNRLTTRLEKMQMQAKTPAGIKRYEEYVR
jgi:hypothetical protein